LDALIDEFANIVVVSITPAKMPGGTASFIEKFFVERTISLRKI
jgi:hypothetical protein